MERKRLMFLTPKPGFLVPFGLETWGFQREGLTRRRRRADQLPRDRVAEPRLAGASPFGNGAGSSQCD